jgi:hypothetical protein
MNEEPNNTAGGPRDPVRSPEVPDIQNPTSPQPAPDPPQPYPVEDPLPETDPGVEPATPQEEPENPYPVTDPALGYE